MSQQEKVRLQSKSIVDYLSETDPKLIPLYVYILNRTATGYLDTTIKDIAKDLLVSERTVHYHKTSLKALNLIIVNQKKYYCEWIAIKSSNATKDIAVVKTLKEIDVEIQTLTRMREELLGMQTEVSSPAKSVAVLDVKSETDSIENIGIKDSNTDLKDSSTDLKQKDSNIRITPSQDLSIDELDTDIQTTVLKLNGRTKKSKVRETLESKPVPPISVSEVVKFGNKFPYSDDPGWFDSFIWKWATERYAKHHIDFMMTANSLRLMRVKLKYFFDKIVKNDWNNAENYIKWYLNQKEKFIAETVGWSFEFMISASCVNKYFLDVSRRPDPNKPAFYTEETRHLAKGTWIKE